LDRHIPADSYLALVKAVAIDIYRAVVRVEKGKTEKHRYDAMK